MGKTIWIINQYGSTPRTGMGGRHFYLSQALAKRGHTVKVICASNHHLLRQPPNLDADILEQAIDNVTYVWLKMPQYAGAHDKKRIWNWFKFSAKLPSLHKKLGAKPDVVLCSSPSLVSFLGAEILARRTNAKLVFEVRDIWPLSLVEIGGYSKNHPFIWLLQRIEDRAYRNADVLVSNLRFAYEHMVERGANFEKFLWIPNGFSADQEANHEPLDEATAALLPQNKKLIGYTGSIGVANALSNMVDAANLLRENSGIHFVIVGAGASKKSLLARVQKLSLNNVTFIDAIPKVQIPAMLATFTACYLGLRSDPLFRFGVSPNKLFDYMGAAKPVIYAVDSGKYNPVEEFDFGISVKPEDPQALAEAVVHICSLENSKLKSMGSNAKRAAYENYEYDILCQKLEQVLLHEKTDGFIL